MVSLFDEWYNLDNTNIYIRDFANIISAIFGRPANLCEYGECMVNFLSIETTGDVYICDLFIGNPDMRLGNIMETDLGDLLKSDKYLYLQNSAQNHHNECLSCSFFGICGGGCFFRRYISHEGISGKDIYCEARKKLISHILKRIRESDRKLAAQ
jgi:uncharacterized protein